MDYDDNNTVLPVGLGDSPDEIWSRETMRRIVARRAHKDKLPRSRSTRPRHRVVGRPAGRVFY